MWWLKWREEERDEEPGAEELRKRVFVACWYPVSLEGVGVPVSAHIPVGALSTAGVF